MKKLFYTLIFFIFLNNTVYCKIKVDFTPSKKCENQIIQLINNSKKTIDIAIYSINNKNIVKALKQAHDRGIKIRILTDRLQASSKTSKACDLYNYGINIRVSTKHKIEHNKFAIYDKKIVSTGSYNWTNTATDKNSENCLFFKKNKYVINRYNGRFSYLWYINTREKSNRWFNNNIKHCNIKNVI